MIKASLKWIPFAVAAAIATASPLVAQTTSGDRTAPQPVPQSSTDLPPPFPHYPAATPREHDPNYHRPTHKQSQTQSTRRAKASRVKADRHAKATHRAAAHRKPTPQYFSKRTVRQCRGMTYQQIMRHSNCRTMMKQELAEHPSRRPHHHASAHQRKSKHHRR